MQRTRGCSSSSNETILEACSSSPSVSTPRPAEVARSSFPPGPSCHLPPSAASLRRSLAPGPDTTAKTGHGYDVVRGRTLVDDEEQDIARADVDRDDDCEGSIDWDADWDEATANSQSRHPVVKRAKLPQTMAFHFDWWLARIATAVVDLDFKALCASMMLWRERNEVLLLPTYQMKVTQRLWLEHDNAVSSATGSRMFRSPSAAPPQHSLITPRRADSSSAWVMDWDILLEEIRVASEQMHQDRKWRIRGKKNAAGWCKWGARQRVSGRGEFVEEPEFGYVVEREVDGRPRVKGLGIPEEQRGGGGHGSG